jgi:hypothetical protein
VKPSERKPSQTISYLATKNHAATAHFSVYAKRGGVDTVFWKNRSKAGKEKQPMKIECNRSIEEREGQSPRFANGRRNSILTVGQWVEAIGRWLNKGILMDMKKVVFKKIR